MLLASRPRSVRPVTLRRIADRLVAEGVGVHVRGDELTEVTGFTLASTHVLPGDLYAGLPGARAHGADFAGEAVALGASAVFTDEVGAARLPADTPVLVVPDPRSWLGTTSREVYGDPSRRLRTIGVTGTQGKTTTTRLLEGALEAQGSPAAVVGTNGTRVLGEEIPTRLTTPEAPELHALFALMVERGVETCVMEVSSHALVMGRVAGILFDVAVFTNLGRDHLDFHADLEDYYAAKASLFTPQRAGVALVNVDDEHGRRLAGEVAIPVRTYSIEGREADWRAADVELRPDGSRFTAVGPGGTAVPVAVPLPGDFNVSNALAAVASAAEAGLDAALVAAGTAEGGGVPGRLERVEVDRDFTVVVDYAHKPDAVAAILRTLRPLTDGRLIIVLGAGGDRDPGKRPLMAEVAARLADVFVVTDDNPRSEDPAAIRRELLEGASGPARVVECGGRREAIRLALAEAGPGDIVLVAGKGHETGQEVAGVVHPFDDRTVVREELP